MIFFHKPTLTFLFRAETPMIATAAAAETEMEEVEASPVMKPHGNAEAMTEVGIVTETVIAAVTGMEIVAVIGMVTGTVIEVDIPVPGRESKKHQRNVQDWPWHPEANPRRKRVEIQLLLQVSLVVLSLLTQCRRRRRWMRSLPERRRKRREQEKRQEKLQNPIHLVQPNQ